MFEPDAAPALMRNWAADGRATFFNRTWLEFRGRTLEEESGAGWLEGIHPDDRERCAGISSGALREPRAYSVEYRLRRADGAYRWILENAAPSRGPTGALLGYAAVGLDITDRRVAEDALRLSEEKHRIIFDTVAHLITSVDAAGVLVDCNRRIKEVLGYDRDEILGSSMTRIIHPEDLPVAEAALREIIERGSAAGTSLRMIRKDGQVRHVQADSAAIRERDGRFVRTICTIQDVTDLKRAEEAVNFTQFAMDKGAEGILLVSQDARFMYANSAACRMLGYSREELLKLSVFDIDLVVTPDRWPSHHDELREKHYVTFESLHRRKDGTVYPVEITRNRLDHEGHTWSCAFFRDISERKAAQEELRASEERYRTLASNYPNGVVTLYDRDLRYTLAEGEELRQIGLSREAVMGRTPEELFGPDLGGVLEPHYRSALEGTPGACEVTIQGRVYEVRTAPVRDGAGTIVAGLAMAQNITAHKAVEAALRESKERIRASQRLLSSILDQSPFSTCVFDADGLLIRFNSAAGRLFGVADSAMVVGKYNIFHDDVLAEAGFAADISRVFTEGITVQFVVEYDPAKVRHIAVAGADPIIVEATLFPIRNEAGRVINVVVQHKDITERRQAEVQREHLEAQLHQAQKMEAIGQLAAGVAHDFNNLLTAILCSAEIVQDLLAGSPGADARVIDALDQIRDAGDRAAGLTRQLLAFSRRQVRRVEVLDVNTVVLEMERMLRRLIGDHVALETSLAADTPFVQADASQFQQIILNLVVNARDAMPQGGTVRIATSNVTLADSDAPVAGGARTGPHVLLTVEDTGMGMDEATLTRIFEPFFSTKAPGHGTGLGLATVYGIVQQSEGHIRVESQPGIGSVFQVFLPQAHADRSLQVSPAKPSLSRCGTETILVCEDEGMVRRQACRILRDRGYSVLEAASAPEAMALFAARPGGIDLLLTDVMMPGMNGHELAEALTRQQEGLRVLLVSGYAPVSTGTRRARFEFLQKPYSPTALLARIRQLLDSPSPAQAR